VEAIVGFTDNGNLVYDYDKKVQSLVNEEELDEIDVIEHIDYNTIRTIPYMGDKHPIIMFPIDK